MLYVDNKFEVGQEVYLVTKTKERLENKCTCDVCMDRGKVTYKGYDVKCPKCKGKGDKEVIVFQILMKDLWKNLNANAQVELNKKSTIYVLSTFLLVCKM